MHYAEGTTGRVFWVRFDHGEDLKDGLVTFVREKNIRAGTVQLIGAIDKTSCVVGPKATVVPPDPRWQEIADAREVVGTGTIAWKGNEPSVHIHTVLGKGEEALVGCIRKETTVYLVIEAMIIEVVGFSAERINAPELGIHKVSFQQERSDVP